MNAAKVVVAYVAFVETGRSSVTRQVEKRQGEAVLLLRLEGFFPGIEFVTRGRRSIVERERRT